MMAVLVATLCFSLAYMQLGEAGSSLGHLRSARATGLQNQLPKTASPSSYTLDLTVNIPQDDTFSGAVSIVLYPIHEVSYVTLNVDHNTITVNSANMYKDDNRNFKFTLTMTKDTELQTLTFWLNDNLILGHKYTLELTYSGRLRNDMEGFYRSTYSTGTKTSVLAATQFESMSARSAFPCWDEPVYKAKFKVSITHNNTLSARSNTVGTTSTTGVSPGYIKTDFAETKSMSSYLLAFLVSDFNGQGSTHTDTTQYTVWVRPDLIDQAKYAADVGARVLHELEMYLGIKFNTMLDKLDLAAIPDFSAGAMENWGLITFREGSMMFQEGESTESARETIALLIAHEQSHMWFGDLVSPAWWSFIWLNEGFARYFQYVSTDLAEKDWRIMDVYVVLTKMPAMEVDALQGSHPMSSNVFTSAEVDGVFDRISYDKGSAILHMTRNVMGETNFKSALKSYLNEMQYSVATPRDLFRNFDKYSASARLPSGVTLTTVLSTWTEQPGYPLISVHVREDGTANVTQTGFFSSPSSTVSSTKWWVPLTFTQESSLDFADTKVTWLNPSNANQEISMSGTGWVIFNLQHKGFYRVNYDSASWKRIITYLKDESTLEKIHLLNRAQLVDDALALARSGALDYATALDLTQYLGNEVDPIPWRAAFSQLNYLSNRLSSNSKWLGYYRQYVLSLLKKAYDLIGFNESPTDDHLTKTFRTTLLTQACDLGLKECVDSAAAAFNELRTSNTAVAVDARSAVYCSALRSGNSAEDWEFLWTRYRETTTANERVLILGVLGCTKDPATLKRYLEMTLTPSSSGVRAQDAKTAFTSVLEGNPENFAVVYDFVRNNLAAMTSSTSYQVNNMKKVVIQGIADRISTEETLTEFQDFLKSSIRAGHLQLTEAVVDSALESARVNLAWRKQHEDTVSRWLAEATGNNPDVPDSPDVPNVDSAAPGSTNLWWPALLLSAVVSWIRIC